MVAARNVCIADKLNQVKGDWRQFGPRWRYTSRARGMGAKWVPVCKVQGQGASRIIARKLEVDSRPRDK